MSTMTDSTIVSTYIQEIQQAWRTGHAKEHGYRPALERLMSSFNDAIAVNDPKRSEYGNPDFVFLKRSHQNVILGYAEAKDVDITLDKTEKSNQMHRYAGYDNLFLTNYLEFRFFKNGIKYQTITIGILKNGQLEFYPEVFSQLQSELQAFLEQPPETIRSGKRLAQIMGAKARRLRDNVSIYLGESSERNQELEKMYKMMQKLLVHDLTTEKFADMYSQTLVYGLFVARYNDDTPESFTRSEARDLVPASNPFLREFFDHIVGPRFDTRLGYIVDELCEVFSVSDVQDIVHKHLRVAQVANDDKDPIIHFYEDFLKEYDPLERKRMGAYYTPIPVAQYMVRSLDEILKREFGLAKGLADTTKRSIAIQRQGIKSKINVHKIQVLDPAVGTATFLNEIIKFIYKGFTGQEGRWPTYAETELLPRLYGFELMMAPYTIAHLKLGLTLRETGLAHFNNRLGVYLTNTLEEGIKLQQDLFSIGLAEVVSREAEEAAKIKTENPIMVVVGNPPYSGVSSNETSYANSLIAKYKIEPGGQQKLQERKHWLNDDYVKFIAFAEDLIAKNGEGVVAMITNHSYLENPTFRGMRWHLAKTFDTIHVLDLHGNSKRQETTLDGSRDENVFDIQQGVAIMIAVKSGKKRANQLARIYRADLYGLRRDKFERLEAYAQEWQEVRLDKPMYYFANKDNAGKTQYEKGVRVNDLFRLHSTGIVTMGDNFIVAESKEELQRRVMGLLEGAYTEQELNQKFGLGKNYAKWVLANRSGLSFNEDKIIPFSYRPFDKRYTYFDNKLVWRHREKVMQHFLLGENIGLDICRQIISNSFSHVFVVDAVTDDSFVSNKSRERGYVLPLYLYHDDGTRTANLDTAVVKNLLQSLQVVIAGATYGLEFVPDATIKDEQVYRDDIKQFTLVCPEDLLDYAYAVLHTPKYLEKYNELLKVDFPRIPKPRNGAQFWDLVERGRQLRSLHLMHSSILDQPITIYPIMGTDEIERVDYEDGKVWINQEQYFGNIPNTAWNHYVGGYQPAQKYLKDRRGRKLSNEEIEHYQKIITVLTRTIEFMSQLDKVS